MQLPVIILALILSCSFGAPLDKPEEPPKRSELTRPSPINPDIPSDPKPDEKITLIDITPQVLPLTSTEPPKLKGPFVLPRELLLREKREDKDSSESDESSSDEDKDEKKSSRPLSVKPVSSIIKPSTSTAAPPPPHAVSVSGAVTSSTAAPIPTQPRIPYAPEIHQHNEHLFKPSTSTSTTTTTSTPAPDHVNDKRDIPVPLTRKFPQSGEVDDEKTKPKPEEEQSTSSTSTTTASPPSVDKVPKEETKEEETKDGNKKTEPAEQHPAPFARPIPVAELFAKKPSTK